MKNSVTRTSWSLMLAFLAMIWFLSGEQNLQAQVKGVGISEDAAIIPDKSAVLELQSLERGLLIPRLTTIQRSNIFEPANGLVVYDTDTKSFWYYDQSSTLWKSYAPGAWAGTSNQVLGITEAGGLNEYKSLIGTVNRVDVIHSAGQIRFSTPQDIHTLATPVFAGLTINGNATIGGTLDVTGNTSLGGTLDVTGAATTSSITNSGNIGTATLSTTGAATLNSATVSTDATVGGTLTLATGSSVNEFSTDGTLSGNSDEAVPTEQAVKSYVDGIVNDQDLHEAYEDGNTITTSAGEGDVVIAGTEQLVVSSDGGLAVSNNVTAGGTLGVAGLTSTSGIGNTGDITNSGNIGTATLSTTGAATLNSAAVSTDATVGGTLTLATGSSVNEFSTDGTLSGNSDEAVPTEQAVKSYVDGIVNDQDLHEAYEDGNTITTSAAEGDVVIAGTEQLVVSSDGGVDVINNVAIGGTLGVTGITSTSGIGNTGDITNSGNIGTATLSTTGAATLNSATVTNGAAIGGNTTVGGTLGVSGNTSLGGTLDVTGAATTSSITNSGNIGTATLSTTGAATLNSAAVSTDATVGGALTLATGSSVNEFSSDGTLSGNSNQAVPTEQAVKSYVDGIVNDQDLHEAYEDGNTITTSAAEGDVVIAGTEQLVVSSDGGVDVINNVAIGGTLGVTGITSTNGIGNTGDITNSGNIGTTTLSTTGVATLNSAAVTNGAAIGGNTTVGGTLGVSGNTSLGGTLDVTGAATTSSITNSGNIGTATLSTTGAATLYSAAVSTDATVGGALTLATGSSVNEFSSDGTLSGNSNQAVPTEQAVKSYVDGIVNDQDLQEAYEDGNTITTSAAEGNVIITGDQALEISAAGGLITNKAEINGGSIDGTTIGGTIPASAVVTDLRATGTVDLGTGSIQTGEIEDGTIINDDIKSDAAISLWKLASGTSAQVIVGDASGVPTYRSMTGDVTINNTGVATITAGAVTGAEIADNTIGIDDIGTGAVGSNEIADGSIENADINAAANIAATKLGTGVVDNDEFNYLNGVTSPIQTQINGIVTMGTDAVEDLNDLITMTGRTANSTHLGTFARSIIPDNSTLVDALQALEIDLDAQTDDQTAIEVPFTAGGNITAANVQAAIAELDAEKVAANGAITGGTKTKITFDAKGLVTSGSDATASDIVNTIFGNITSVTVQGAINELETNKLALAGGTMSGDIVMGGNDITGAGAISGTTLTGTTVSGTTVSGTTVTGTTLTDGTFSVTGGAVTGVTSLSASGVLTGSQVVSTVANGTPPFVVSSTTAVPNLTATTAINIAGGAGGSIPYQSAANTTMMLANGTAGTVLTSNGGTNAPTWQTFPNWSMTGNAGIDPETQFIGTTDNKDMVFRTNNTEAMRLQASTGDLIFGGDDVGTVKANLELNLKQEGDVYGSSILQLRNREDENGAIFQTISSTAHPNTDLVDFIFRTGEGANFAQRNIRFEARAASAQTGDPSFHIGGLDPDIPTLSIGDDYSAFNKPLKIGNFDEPTATLEVSGSLTTSGGLVNINTDSPHSTYINTGNSTGDVTIGNSSSRTNIESATNVIGIPGTSAGNGVRIGNGRFTINKPEGFVNIGNTDATPTVGEILDAGIFVCNGNITGRKFILPAASGANGMVRALPGTPAVGDVFTLIIVNRGSSSIRLTEGTGITVRSSVFITSSSTRVIYCRVSSVVPNSETIDIF